MEFELFRLYLGVSQHEQPFEYELGLLRESKVEIDSEKNWSLLMFS